MALSVAVAVWTLGTTFTAGAESSASAAGAGLAWLIPAAMVSAPFWVGAAALGQPGRLAGVVRYGSALATFVPAWYAGSIVLHQGGLMGTGMFSLPTFAAAAAFVTGMVVAVVMMIAPPRAAPASRHPAIRQ